MSDFPEPIPIVFCTTDLDAGGAERALVQLATRLDRGEWRPHVVCLSGGGELLQPLAAADVPVICLGATQWWNVGILIRLRRELKRIRPALLQTYLFHANIAGRIAGRLAGVPRTVSGIRVAEQRSRFRLWLDRVTERWVDRHVCVSQGVATFSTTTGRLSRDKTVVIPNGVEYEMFAEATPADLSEFGISPHHQTLLFVGRLDAQKGIEVLLDAFGQLAQTQPTLHLLLAGDGPLRATVEEFARQRALESRVHLPGRRGDIPHLMQAADCLVLPSLWEGMPNAVLEAMAAGLPVIATAVEGVSELLVDGETGRVIPRGDAGALVRAVSCLVANPAAASRAARRAQLLVRETFTWDRVVQEYVALYRSLLPAQRDNLRPI
ncbi:MAG: glycosyltransferase [Planctomycetaceae bacterium]